MMKMAVDEDKTRNDARSEEGEAMGSLGSAMRTSETLLRVVPIGLCLAALLVMLKNSQENDYGSVSYSNLGAFKYLVYANGICAGYSFLSAFYTAVPRPSSMSRAWTIFFLDQLLTYVILAAGTVSAEIVYLAYNGDQDVTWSKECGMFNGFCKRAKASVTITFGSVACYILLSLLSSYRLFSSYDAPIAFLSSKAVEIAAFPR